MFLTSTWKLWMFNQSQRERSVNLLQKAAAPKKIEVNWIGQRVASSTKKVNLIFFSSLSLSSTFSIQRQFVQQLKKWKFCEKNIQKQRLHFSQLQRQMRKRKQKSEKNVPKKKKFQSFFFFFFCQNFFFSDELEHELICSRRDTKQYQVIPYSTKF